ncbi:EamA family transporter RarD [Luteococcus sp. Sow4_B9]|uniref:EamA family transporter RarD n=1 Tax=Luteococcus sp. Sow4_B9 TaxID=3438792 RepID=UPI003F9AB16A
MTDHEPTHSRQALLAGIGCYLIWGGFPLFWPLLKPAGALEILAGRIVFSLVFVAVMLLVLRRSWGWVRTAARRDTWPWLLAASVLIGLNWLTYIWAVNSSHVVEASLGYFINPLVSIALGLLLFGERMSRYGQIGCVLALVGVCIIAWGNWRTLWVSLVLAFSFGLYGAMKKRARLGALEGLTAETLALTPLALGWLGWLAIQGTGQIGVNWRVSLLMVAAGVLTAVPLWLFAVAAPGIPLGTLGILQYLAPTMQLLLGLFVFGQQVSAGYWAGMVLVWSGCLVYLAGAIGSMRRARS